MFNTNSNEVSVKNLSSTALDKNRKYGSYRCMSMKISKFLVHKNYYLILIIKKHSFLLFQRLIKF